MKRLLLIVLVLFGQALCQSKGESEDIGAMMIHHVTDKSEWKILPGITIPLHNITLGPVTIPFTNHVLMILISSCIVLTVFMLAYAKKGAMPGKLAMALEPLVLFVRDGIVYPSMGEKLGKRWLGFHYVLFFFIITTNMLGLIPFFSTATGNLSITSALALMVFVAIVAQGMGRNGFIGFFKNMIPEGVAWPLGVFLLVIDIANLFVRCAVLSIRLFANMIAGHFVIFTLLLLMFILHPLAGVISVPLALFIDLLEVLITIIQAMVFTILSAIFIGLATNHH